MFALKEATSGWRWLPLTAVVILLDQVTKQLIVDRFKFGETRELLPVLDLQLVYNTGAAFSFLASASAGSGGSSRRSPSVWAPSSWCGSNA